MRNIDKIQAAALTVEATIKGCRSFDDVSKIFKQTTILTNGTYYQAGDTHYTKNGILKKEPVTVKTIPSSFEGWFGLYKPFANEVELCVDSMGFSYHGGASFVLRIDGVAGIDSQIKTLICDYPPIVRCQGGSELSTYDFWEKRRKDLFPIGNVFLKYPNTSNVDDIDVTKPVLIV